MANKVKYGLRNVYYALATIASDGSATYDVPVPIPGAVSISFDPSGEDTIFYADDRAYFTVGGAMGYSGTLEIAMIPDSFRKDVMGEIVDKNGALVEVSDASPKPFALLFDFTGDESQIKHVLYNCTATRPSMAGTTKGESVEVATDTLNITASNIYNASLDKNIAKAKADSSVTAYAGWSSAVYQPIKAD